ncbi:hypothetical protein [Pedobacter alluvionis]|uniref:Uncharacterized protein n=1 Tax=Pedobacter alluvionis TaxID=475253 RepID=A0A497Y845_9SPHI|nr:hypothetical protein [Pedobacter alluvionis]RLJ77138.1 hypothetical protein BCL90_2209 [Pedobacter alluvionis]TFB33624.1 hypothetical protein E3V97_06160 [Pedobacter alluvionis]
MNKFILIIAVAILSGCQSNSRRNGLSDTSLTDSSIIDSTKKPVYHVTKLDSAKIKFLKKSFKITKDEFDANEMQWVRPIDEPRYVNRNGIYSYFQTNKGVASNLRFVIQYYSDDWLFIQKYQFSIDGKAYEYIPSKVETDNGDGGMIWEWFDDQADENLKTIMEAITKSKTTKIKMVGRQYFDIKTVTSRQKESIRKTLELYKLQGGS